MQSVVRARSVGLWWPVLALAMLALSACSDSGSKSKYADIRLLNLSPDYPSLDLYVNAADGKGDSLKLEGVGFETISEYKKSDASTYSVVMKRNGVTAGTLGTLPEQKQADGTHATYVAYGATGKFGLLRVNDDVSAANENKTKVTILNTAQAGTVDVYLTDPTVALTDGAATVAALPPGSSTGTLFLDSGNYRLRVVGTGDTEDLRLDLSDVTLGSKGVVTIILTGTTGGATVGAVVLPQQGAPSIRHNVNARVRGAIGTTAGVNLGIGGVTLLTGAAAGVVSSHYSFVPAGAAAVSLQVGGAAVSVPTQQLVAGGDYTVLVWSNGSGPQFSLLADNNETPSASTKTKLRVLNGISGPGTPITLAVDFLPVAEAVAVGTSSAYSEFDGTVDAAVGYQLDVSDANTTTNLVSKSVVVLTAGNVYTLLVSGDTTINATVRKDR